MKKNSKIVNQHITTRVSAVFALVSNNNDFMKKENNALFDML